MGGGTHHKEGGREKSPSARGQHVMYATWIRSRREGGEQERRG